MNQGVVITNFDKVTTGDLVNEIIKAYKQRASWHNTEAFPVTFEEGQFKSHLKAVIDYTKKNAWINATDERALKPLVYTQVIVAYEVYRLDGSLEIDKTLAYLNGDGKWMAQNYSDDCEITHKVVAWMPVPDIDIWP